MKTINLSPKHIDSLGAIKENKKVIVNKPDVIKRLIKYLKGYKSLLIIMFLLIIIYVICETVSIFMLSPIIDNYILPIIEYRNLDYYLPGLIQALILFIVLCICSAISQYVQSIIAQYIAQNIIEKMRNEMIVRLNELPMSFFDKYKSGDLMSRMVNDLDNLATTLSISIRQITSGILFIVVAICMMAYMSVELSLICICSIPMIFLVSNKINNLIKTQYSKQQKSLGELNNYISEYIKGIKIIKIFGREKTIQDKFNILNEQLRSEGFKAQSLSSLVMLSVSIISNLSVAITSILSAAFVIMGKISMGNIATFIKFAENFSKPFLDVSQNLALMQSGLSGAERVFNIIDTKNEYIGESEEIKRKLEGKIEFKNVSFGYTNQNEIIHNASFVIEKGTTIAIVGPTGAGKSTIANLLLRLYEIEKGEITLNGINIKSINKNDLRRNIAVVLQDTILFADTINQNILLGKSKEGINNVKALAKLLNIDDEFEILENGYETIVDNENANISEGQKQLINIMRIFQNNQPILILDEATSSIDTRMEKKIYSAINTILEDRTNIIIAHRLTTIQNADKILFVKDGYIVEQGTHIELMNKKGEYYNMYNEGVF